MRVILADDSAIIRTGIAQLLRLDGVTIAAELEDASGLVDAVSELEPDAVVVDIRMPPTHTLEGLIAATDLRQRNPSVGILVLSQHLESRYALDLVRSGGGVGYLLKDRITRSDELVTALRRVAAGHTVVDPDIVAQLMRRARGAEALDRLTSRERDVLELMAEGFDNVGITERLVISPKTLESHIRSIFTKLDLAESDGSRRVLAVLAWLSPASS